MAVYVIADLHLSLGAEDKPMDVFGGAWVGYMDRIRCNWENTVGPEDTVVIPGDISWAMRLEDSLEDLRLIHELPGNKIIIRGNHDYWWDTVTKMQRFLDENRLDSIKILHNNAYEAENCVICGSRLWDSVGSGSDQTDRKAYAREVGRLRLSLEKGKALQQSMPNPGEIIAFSHFPPTATYDGQHQMLQLLKEYGVGRCYYGHIHGPGIAVAPRGDAMGVELMLVSADAIGFKPVLVKSKAKQASPVKSD